MIVRELITKFGFAVDEASVKKVEAAINRLKNAASDIEKPLKAVSNQFRVIGNSANVAATRTTNALNRIKSAAQKANAAVAGVKTRPAQSVQPSSAPAVKGGNDTWEAFGMLARRIAAFEAGKKILEVGDDTQNLRARIGLLNQTVEDGVDPFKEIIKHANDARVSVSDYANFYVKLGMSTSKTITTQKELLQLSDTVSKALTIGGASTSEKKSVLQQLPQALNRGQLMGEEFNALAENGGPILRMIAEKMDVPFEKMKEMGSQGKLTSKFMIEGLRKVGPEIEKMFDKMPMTTGDAFQNIKNQFSDMIDDINQETNFIRIIAESVVSAIKKVKAAADVVRDAFDGWGNFFRFFGILAGLVLGAILIPKILAAAQAVALFVRAFGWIGVLLTAIALLVEDIVVWIEGGDSAIGLLLGSWESFKLKVENVWESIKEAFVETGENMETYWHDLWDKLIATVNEWIEKGKSVFKEFGSFLYDTIYKGIANAVSDGIKKLGEIPGISWAADKLSSAAAFNSETDFNKAFPIQTRPNVNQTTNVNLTVPAGTSAEQANFVQNAAQTYFGGMGSDKMARDLGVYAR